MALGLFDGVMNLTGKLDVLDARFLDVRLTQYANLLETRYPDLTLQQRRAKAVTLLANPAQALALLHQARQEELLLHDTNPATTAATTAPAPVAGAVVPIDRLRPTLGIAVHLHTDTMGNLNGAARIDKAGHITTRLLGQLLDEAHGINLKIHPVIDLPNLQPADAYTPSPIMRRAIALIFDTEPFPYSNRSSTRLDLDHTIAYQPGHPHQTRIGNLAPLTRGVHRAKTAGFWTLNQHQAGHLEWTSPLGYRYLVTPFGTTTDPPVSPRRSHRG